MTVVVHYKDIYDIIHDTISPGIMKETKILKTSKVLEVVVKDKENSKLLDRSVCLIKKDVSTDLLALGVSTMNKDEEDSTNVTSITTKLNGTSQTFRLYRPFNSSVVDASCVVEYKTHDIHTVCTGDLCFIATMFGKDGMSSHWCPYCQLTKQEWSKKRPSAKLVQDNLWTDELMQQKLLEYNAAKGQNKLLNGILGVNNDKLWPFSPDETIPSVVHLPLGLIQYLWDYVEKFITSVSNVSDGE